MKKILLFIVLLIPFQVNAISASSAIAMDLNSDRVFYENNINDERLIASITKIMTCIIAIENSDIDKEVTVGEEVLKAFGSAIYIEIGEKLTLKDLLYGLMLRSGNDAAMVIAKNVAGDMELFADLMNNLASSIGMKNTNFVNSHGLEENDGSANISTAYDMALLTKYAMQNKIFREIFSTPKMVVKTNYKTYSWTNKNKLLHRYDYITGGKTGFTEKARRTLVTTASKDNLEVVVVTLNDPNDFQDHITLYESVFDNYEGILVLDKDNFKVKKDKIYKDHKLFIKNNYYAAVKDKEKDDLHIEYQLYKNKKYIDGDVVGNANIYLKDELLHKEDIYVEVKETKESKAGLWGKIIGWFKKW